MLTLPVLLYQYLSEWLLTMIAILHVHVHVHQQVCVNIMLCQLICCCCCLTCQCVNMTDGSFPTVHCSQTCMYVCDTYIHVGGLWSIRSVPDLQPYASGRPASEFNYIHSWLHCQFKFSYPSASSRMVSTMHCPLSSQHHAAGPGINIFVNGLKYQYSK